jgi:hypothetical protein
MGKDLKSSLFVLKIVFRKMEKNFEILDIYKSFA